MIVQIVRFRSSLSKENVRQTMEERMPHYADLQGLRQKYYIEDNETGEVGGIYIWEDEDAMIDFQRSGLAQTMGSAYQAEAPSTVDTFEVLEVLRAYEATGAGSGGAFKSAHPSE